MNINLNISKKNKTTIFLYIIGNIIRERYHTRYTSTRLVYKTARPLWGPHHLIKRKYRFKTLTNIDVTMLQRYAMYLIFFLSQKISLYGNLFVLRKKTHKWNRHIMYTNLSSRTPATSWWQFRFNSDFNRFHLSMLSPIKIFPLFLSLSACLFLSFLAESVKLIGLPRFLVVAIIVDRPRRMSRDPFKGGVYSNRLYFFACR